MPETPSTRARSLAQKVRVSRSIVWRILREHDMHAFHVQLVQALLPDNHAHHTVFHSGTLKCLLNIHFEPAKVLFLDEISFTMEGILNT